MKTILATLLALVAASHAMASDTPVQSESLKFRGVVEKDDSSWTEPWRVAHFQVDVVRGSNSCFANDVELVPWSEFTEDGVLRMGVEIQQVESNICPFIYMPVVETVLLQAPYKVGFLKGLELDLGNGNVKRLGVPNQMLWRAGLLPGDGSK